MCWPPNPGTEEGDGVSILPVELMGIRKVFGRNAVLRGLDLTLSAGEIVGLVGANGSGKTTLFNVLTGLEQPDAGELRFAGRSVRTVDTKMRGRMGHVAHATQLYPLLSGRENLQLFADLRQAASPTAASSGAASIEPAKVLTRLGLDAAAVERPVQTYSRGMKQRTALGRALAGRADLLILDEPFTALDGPGRAHLAEILREERARGACILLSSHDLESLCAVADRVIRLADGRIDGEARGELGAQLRDRAVALLQATPA